MALGLTVAGVVIVVVAVTGVAGYLIEKNADHYESGQD